MATKRGRPPRSAEGTAVPISVRLPSMTKLGAKILANDHNSSLAQAVEFALNEVFHSHKLRGGRTVAEVLSAIPREATERVQQMVLYGVSPHLTEFEYRSPLIAVWTSKQMRDIERKYANDPNMLKIERVKLFEWFDKHWGIFRELAGSRWNRLNGWDLQAEIDDVLEATAPKSEDLLTRIIRRDSKKRA